MSDNKINLIIFPGNFLPNVGGLETHVDEFVKYLSKNDNYNITIFSPHTSGGRIKETIHTGVKVIRYPAFFLIPNFPVPKFWSLTFWKLFRNLYSKNFNVVMTRTRFFTNSFLGLVFAKFRLWNKLILIHVEHGSGYVKVESEFTNFISKVYDNIFGRMIFKFSDKNISISDAVWNFVQKFDGRESPKIPRGVDFSIYDKKKFNFDLSKYKSDDKLLIGFVGRLYKWKGVENTIKAFLDLPDELKSKCNLLIVGDGEDFERLKNLCGANLNNNIFMLGSIEFSKAIDVYKQLDIFVHSAYVGGGLSNSLLQAMYCGCSVIASPNEGANEVVIDGENGILLKDNSVKNLKIGLVKLIKSKTLMDKYSKSSTKYIKNNFDWDIVIEKYVQVFDNVLRGKK